MTIADLPKVSCTKIELYCIAFCVSFSLTDTHSSDYSQLKETNLITKFLKYPSPIRKVSKPNLQQSGRVLTSSQNLKILEDKEKQKQQAALEKEERKRVREEKRLLKEQEKRERQEKKAKSEWRYFYSV